MDVHKGSLNTVLGQGVGQQVIAAAVDGLLGHDMLSRLSQGLDDVSDGRGAGGGGQRRHTPLQGGQPSLQYILSGVGQPTVDVPCVRQTKPGGGVGGIAEDIAGGLVDGHRPGVGGGVGLLLPHMELQCLKLITHGNDPPLSKLTPLYSDKPTLSIGILTPLEILLTLWYDREKWRGFL